MLTAPRKIDVKIRKIDTRCQCFVRVETLTAAVPAPRKNDLKRFHANRSACLAHWPGNCIQRPEPAAPWPLAPGDVGPWPSLEDIADPPGPRAKQVRIPAIDDRKRNGTEDARPGASVKGRCSAQITATSSRLGRGSRQRERERESLGDWGVGRVV